MATESPVNITPSGCSSAVGRAADTFTWQPNPLTMHVTRPKSAKGRTRPSLHVARDTEGCANRTPASPPVVTPCPSSSSWKPGASTPRSPSQRAPDEIPERLQQVSIRASPSLNKYPVLPSINRKNLEETAGETGATKVRSLQLSRLVGHYQEEICTMKTSKEDSRAQACLLEEEGVMQAKRRGSAGSGNLEEPSDQEPRLLLAVRSPSGQRFVRYFRPTDNLQTVVAVAEQKNNTTYPRCSVETVEVPRRCFGDLTKSLQECRIPHKSVLSISQGDSTGWP
ncbi:PREDICTED: UBX domain-containing protein 10 [Elephantulus edwardii]|uniref:UBX domain-containing protein 10 n=1 Tax=Elephantulus edwardii TaxID=28737 RepID=UPI0003F0D9A4|nr:PREDICTED: UBX domain-containing protein 10 [Elephantulus edwardii]